MAVNVSPTEGLRLEPFEMRELEDLVQQTTPVPRVRRDSTGTGTGSGAASGSGVQGGTAGDGAWGKPGFAAGETGGSADAAWVKRLRGPQKPGDAGGDLRDRGVLSRLVNGVGDRIERIDENVVLDVHRPGVVRADEAGNLRLDGDSRFPGGVGDVVDPYKAIPEPEPPQTDNTIEDRKDDRDDDDDDDDRPDGSVNPGGGYDPNGSTGGGRTSWNDGGDEGSDQNGDTDGGEWTVGDWPGGVGRLGSAFRRLLGR